MWPLSLKTKASPLDKGLDIQPLGWMSPPPTDSVILLVFERALDSLLHVFPLSSSSTWTFILLCFKITYASFRIQKEKKTALNSHPGAQGTSVGISFQPGGGRAAQRGTGRQEHWKTLWRWMAGRKDLAEKEGDVRTSRKTATKGQWEDWGDSSVGKVLVIQLWGSQFWIPSTYIKVCHTCNPNTGGQRYWGWENSLISQASQNGKVWVQQETLSQ